MTAAAVTGNNLKEYCDAPAQTPNILYCDGYTAGALDSFRFMNSSGANLFCEPHGVTGPQLIAMTKKQLDDHPETLHFDASSIILKMMHDNFPCPTKPCRPENSN